MPQYPCENVHNRILCFKMLQNYGNNSLNLLNKLAAMLKFHNMSIR